MGYEYAIYEKEYNMSSKFITEDELDYFQLSFLKKIPSWY